MLYWRTGTAEWPVRDSLSPICSHNCMLMFCMLCTSRDLVCACAVARKRILHKTLTITLYSLSQAHTQQPIKAEGCKHCVFDTLPVCWDT